MRNVLTMMYNIDISYVQWIFWSTYVAVYVHQLPVTLLYTTCAKLELIESNWNKYHEYVLGTPRQCGTDRQRALLPGARYLVDLLDFLEMG